MSDIGAFQGRTAEDLDRFADVGRELLIGRQIQAGFLPEQLPVLPGWEIEVEFRPAREVAGDFYDVFELPGSRRTALIVADVCDKGVGAALFMALIRTMLRHTAQNSGLRPLGTLGWDPHSGRLPTVGETPLLHAVTSTNRYLTQVHHRQGYFATLFFGILDPETGVLSYINGGHNPPLLFAEDGALRAELEPTGPAVGVLPDPGFEVGRIRIEPGEFLLAFTDGVTESRASSGEFFGDERLTGLATVPCERAQELTGRIMAAIEHHSAAGEQYDDITMLVLRRDRENQPTDRNGRQT
ncbi:PP2C family protein-serine/threonine phosphatase [Actinospica robiniae]|uniref:PP2C family protein-serine/threonine phosphatase n=1 Tax=Actinospica robiniae TaxID=304901 RepID=UPI0003F58E4A|nr:PP2C family protein-serine/threonine phosphatase [Actinospica robiniae]